jgi:hypothetical protein
MSAMRPIRVGLKSKQIIVDLPIVASLHTADDAVGAKSRHYAVQPNCTYSTTSSAVI